MPTRRTPLEHLDAIAAALVEVAAAVEQQRTDLRLALEVLVEVATKLDGPGTALAPTANGVEVGALMGATQAAWLRLEQRIENEFSEIHRQLGSMSGSAGPAIAPPLQVDESGATADQLRRAASSLRESFRGLRRQRRS